MAYEKYQMEIGKSTIDLYSCLESWRKRCAQSARCLRAKSEGQRAKSQELRAKARLLILLLALGPLRLALTGGIAVRVLVWFVQRVEFREHRLRPIAPDA